MISSMTGYSAATLELETGSLSLEIRGVNSRHLDMQFRIPEEMRHLETILREKLASHVARGKVECRISYTQHPTSNLQSSLNLPLVHQLAQWSSQVQAILPAAQDLNVADILQWDGVLTCNTLTHEVPQSNVINLLEHALVTFNAARSREGNKLKSFVLHRIGLVNTLCSEITPRISEAIKAYEVKLRRRLLDAIGNNDNERIHQEISLFASKIDIDEELSRLHCHLEEFERIIEQGGSIGKRLEFLTQELHREANTLGSKSVDAEVSRVAMEMKILIEQIREQIQNLE